MQPGFNPRLVIIVSYLGSQASATVGAHFGPRWPGPQNGKVTRLVERTAVGGGGRGWVSHPPPLAHPARARRRVRAARDFISPEAAGAPIYLYSGGDVHCVQGCSRRFFVYRLVAVFSPWQPYAPPSRALRPFVPSSRKQRSPARARALRHLVHKPIYTDLT
jgi:hypothetical protein